MQLSKPIAFYLQASIIVSFLAGSSAPTPLYGLYQAAWGFSPITVTVIFGIYAVAVLAALLVVGSLSDYVGRRPVLILATFAQAVTMALYLGASDVSSLIAARIVQGLATGAAAGALGAGLMDLDRKRGTIANAISPMLGTGTGALLSGLLCVYLPAPTKLVYLVLDGIYMVQLVGLALMPETVTPRPGALASLRPKFRLPPQARAPMMLAIPALTGAWALAGFYGSLGPSLVKKLSGSTSPLVGGVALSIMAVSGAATVFLLRERTPRLLMLWGNASLALGTAIIVFAIGHFTMPVFFFGVVVAGSGFGAAFQGAIRTVVPLATVHERAGVLSILYVVAYLAMGLPAIAGGVRIVYGNGLIDTAREYGFAVMAFAAIAFVGTLYRAEPKSVLST